MEADKHFSETCVSLKVILWLGSLHISSTQSI